MTRRVIELDGLRGIAILLVIIGHYCSYIFPNLEFFAFASVGVTIFFVLSGFLIGGIILDQHENAGFLSSFYRRRAARIFPLYFVVVVLAFFAQTATMSEPWTDRLFPFWVYLTFLTNFAFAHFGISGVLLTPTWSLAVEEQFYLVIPFLIMAAPARRLPVYLATLCIVAIASRQFYAPNVAAVETLLLCRMDALLIGVGAALAYRRYNLPKYRMGLLKGAAISLAAVLATSLFSREAAALLAPTGYALATALFLLAAINGLPSARVLRAPWLRFFGEISYGLYLLHEPLRVILTGTLIGKTIFMPGLDRIPVSLLAFTLAVTAATVSWRYFEQPVIQWAARTPEKSAQ